MPWECKTLKEQREEFVRRALAHKKSKRALCREYGISRPTGDKWIKRFLNGDDLADKSRRPFKTANKISIEDEERIIKARLAEPGISACKTRKMPVENGWDDAPSISTFNAVFKRNGLIAEEDSQKAAHYKRFEKNAPNIMWQADFKGDFLLEDNTRVYPLSIIDDHSRFCLNADAKNNLKLSDTKESFIKAFKEFGTPQIILCDNGNPWGASQSTAITGFEVWLMELGILTIHISPKHPQTQGKVERFNRSYKNERLKFYLPKNLEDAQRTRLEYMDFYNNRRPHFALNLDTPAQHYKRSDREYCEAITPWSYTQGVDLRTVKESGYLTFNGQGFFLSEGIRGKEVAIVKTDKDGVFDIVFRQFRVARLDWNQKCFISKKVFLLDNDPRALL